MTSTVTKDEESGHEYFEDKMWKRMIEALSHNDYEKWDNYPHEVPWIRETEVINI